MRAHTPSSIFGSAEKHGSGIYSSHHSTSRFRQEVITTHYCRHNCRHSLDFRPKVVAATTEHRSHNVDFEAAHRE